MTYKVYDEVWVMEWNKPTKKIVFAVIESMHWLKIGTDLHYRLVNSRVGSGWGNDLGDRYPEKDIYPTKEDIIKSLVKEE